MNKVFKVVWNKAKNCYVVASELAKRRTKSPKSNVLSKMLTASILASVISFGCVVPMTAEAKFSYEVISSNIFDGNNITGTAKEDGFIIISNGDADNTHIYIDGVEVAYNYSDWSGLSVPIGKGSTYKIVDSDGTFNAGKIYFCATEISSTSAEKAVKEILKKENINNYSAGNGIVISSDNKVTAKAGTNVTVNSGGISVTGNGTVASGNTGLISGGTAYSELRPSGNGNYVTPNQPNPLPQP